MLDYARLFGLKTIVFRHSTIFGGRQFSTFDQGWIGWFVQQAIETQRGTLKEPFTISGTGKQVRDILFASDLIDCYFTAIEKIDQTSGQAFNMGGGMENSLSILELFSILEDELKIKLNYRQLPWRVSDQKIFVADTTKARMLFGFQPKVDKLTGLRSMIEWIQSQ
jgi:CDP-paratose 2-epimerase